MKKAKIVAGALQQGDAEDDEPLSDAPVSRCPCVTCQTICATEQF